MLLTKFGPAFHETSKVPRGVAWAEPGGPGSARTGPKVTWPSAWSHVMCLVRSTQAVAVAGQEWRSNEVSASEVGWGVGVSGWSGRWAALPGCGVVADVDFWEWRMNAVVCGALEPEEATAAPITTAMDPVATVSKAARRRAEWRLLAWVA